MQKLTIISVFILVSSFSTLFSQEYNAYAKEQYVSAKDTLPYRILLPQNYDATKKYPLLLFLHGSGERGSDNELQLVHGANLFLGSEIRQKFESIVVFPQCKTNASWNNARYSRVNGINTFQYPEIIEENTELDLVEGLIKQLRTSHSIDENRIYLGGLSMGGMGTFELLHRNPGTFAAAFAICGGANPKIAGKIKNTPLWIFHGENDDVVPAAYSKNMFEALKQEKANVKITIYPNVKHDSWTATFAEPELLPWLFSHSN